MFLTRPRRLRSTDLALLHQKLIFESSEAVSVVSTFDDLGLKEDLLRGIYAYSACAITRPLRSC